MSYVLRVRQSNTNPSTTRPVWSPLPSSRWPWGVVFESGGQYRSVGVFQGSRFLNSRSQPPSNARYFLSTTHFPLFSFPPYSPSATLMRSPGSAFSSAWNGSRNGFSRVPTPPLSPARTYQSRPCGRAEVSTAFSNGAIESTTMACFG